MGKSSHIKRSIYNQGDFDIEHLVPGEVVLTDLGIEKDRLKKVVRLLKTFNQISQPKPACPTKLFITAEDFLSHPPSCELDSSQFLDRVFDKLVFTHSELDHIHSFGRLNSLAVSKYVTQPNDRIAKLNQELWSLRQELRRKPCKEILQQIKVVVQELHTIFSLHYSEQRKHLRRFRVLVFGVLIRDIRRILRQIVHFIFKNLSDFSGCEEEGARFNVIVNFKPVFLQTQSKKSCITPNSYLTH